MLFSGLPPVTIADVFKAYTRTGTGASATITTNIDLSTNGGMVWSKGRSGATDHAIYDTARGATYDIGSNLTTAQTTQAQGLTAFGTTGHTWGTLAKVNTSSATYIDWVFRKHTKFFDVVTYTGNGSNRTIAHSLGVAPGMIWVKRTDNTGSWMVYHNSINNTEHLLLESATTITLGSSAWASTTATDSVFSIGTDANVNTNLGTYVAYLFAHDDSGSGMIQCGSYIGNELANGPTIYLGWQPQFIIIKRATPDGANGPWRLIDTARGIPTGSGDKLLSPQNADAESDVDTIDVSATGFKITASSNGWNDSTRKLVYCAIRSTA